MKIDGVGDRKAHNRSYVKATFNTTTGRLLYGHFLPLPGGVTQAPARALPIRGVAGKRQLLQEQEFAAASDLTLMLSNFETRSQQRYTWTVSAEADKSSINLASEKSGWLPVQ